MFGGDSSDEESPDSKTAGARVPGKHVEDIDDVDDFIVGDDGQPIRRRKEDGTYTEP